MGANPNPYLRQLQDRLSEFAEVRPFSWRDALRWDYDVLHVHWAESLLRYSRQRTAVGRMLRPATNRLSFLLLLLRIRRRHIAVVVSQHNLAPHEPLNRFDSWLAGALADRTAMWIRLNPFTPTPDPARTVTILHGHYRDWFARYPTTPRPVPGRLLFFGHVRPYKGLEDLFTAFEQVAEAGVTLRVVGKPSPDDFAQRVRAGLAADDRISGRLEYVDEETLVGEIRSAQLVVLPYPHMHNSGVALLCLSQGRPVLVPDNEVNRALATEVGDGWVHLFHPPITAAQLEAALDRVERLTAPVRPQLDARDWQTAGEQHRQVFESALVRSGRWDDAPS